VATMLVVSDAEIAGTTVLNRIDHGPCLRGSADSNSWCGHCGRILLAGVDPARVSDVIFRCECGAYNRPVA